MAEDTSHLKEFDPNAKPEAAAPEAEKPARTVQSVHAELMRAIVAHLGNHPLLTRLLDEFLALSAPPPPPPEPAETEGPQA